MPPICALRRRNVRDARATLWLTLQVWRALRMYLVSKGMDGQLSKNCRGTISRPIEFPPSDESTFFGVSSWMLRTATKGADLGAACWQQLARSIVHDRGLVPGKTMTMHDRALVRRAAMRNHCIMKLPCLFGAPPSGSRA